MAMEDGIWTPTQHPTYIRMHVFLTLFMIKKNIFLFVLVRYGSTIPISKVGNSSLPHPNPYRTLVLKNILITSQIIKNLIYVRRFTRENRCTIELDPFCFL